MKVELSTGRAAVTILWQLCSNGCKDDLLRGKSGFAMHACSHRYQGTHIVRLHRIQNPKAKSKDKVLNLCVDAKLHENSFNKVGLGSHHPAMSAYGLRHPCAVGS